MGKYDDRPYEVGKGKPPKNTQFRPGESGNPKGPRRKPKAANATMNELLADILAAPVILTVTDPKTGRDKEVKVSLRETILMGVARDGANGTPEQRLKVFKELSAVGAFDLRPMDRQETPGEASERVAEFIKLLAAECEAEGMIERMSNDPDDPNYNSYREK